MEQEKTEFNIDYYFSIIERFHSAAIDFELIGDKFFELQRIAANLPDEVMIKIENHDSYKSCDTKLSIIANILAKIK